MQTVFTLLSLFFPPGPLMWPSVMPAWQERRTKTLSGVSLWAVHLRPVCLINPLVLQLKGVQKALESRQSDWFSLPSGGHSILSSAISSRTLPKRDSLVGGLGVRPAIQTVHVVVPDWRAVAEELLAVHAQSLVVQAHVLRFQRCQRGQTLKGTKKKSISNCSRGVRLRKLLKKRVLDMNVLVGLQRRQRL